MIDNWVVVQDVNLRDYSLYYGQEGKFRPSQYVLAPDEKVIRITEKY